MMDDADDSDRGGRELQRFPRGERCPECGARRWYIESGFRYCQRGHRIEVGGSPSGKNRRTSDTSHSQLNSEAGLRRVRGRAARGRAERPPRRRRGGRPEDQREAPPVRRRGDGPLRRVPPARDPGPGALARQGEGPQRRAGDGGAGSLGPAHARQPVGGGRRLVERGDFALQLPGELPGHQRQRE